MPASAEPASTRNIYVFGITSFLNDTASEMAYWVLPAFLVSLGAGPAQLGLIAGLAESVASFAKLFSGYVADHASVGAGLNSHLSGRPLSTTLNAK